MKGASDLLSNQEKTEAPQTGGLQAPSLTEATLLSLVWRECSSVS
jgi:hypothetical protein